MENNEFRALQQIIEQDPLWYQNPKIMQFLDLFNKGPLSRTEKSAKSGFVKLLKESNFYVGDTGYDWDQWRLPIDHAVIHHSSSAPTISLNELNVLGLRLYIQQFLTDEDVKNQPLYSGHYWYKKPRTKENMCFVSYHYLVRPSGKITQLVDTSAYLWHAGNLEINRKSIGIVFAGKFIDKEPTAEALTAASTIIKELRIPKANVLGHGEVIKKELIGETICPGNTFLHNWKKKLIDLL